VITERRDDAEDARNSLQWARMRIVVLEQWGRQLDARFVDRALPACRYAW